MSSLTCLLTFATKGLSCSFTVRKSLLEKLLLKGHMVA